MKEKLMNVSFYELKLCIIEKKWFKLSESQFTCRMGRQIGTPVVLVRINLERIKYLALSRHSVNVSIFPISEFHV